MADYAVEKHYRIIGAGTHDGIFKAAAKKFGDTYGFTYIKTTYSTSEVREYLKKGCVAISHVPGHYVTVADFNPKTKKYLVLDSHPIRTIRERRVDIICILYLWSARTGMEI